MIGRRTDDCIRAGVFFGAVDSIDGLVRRTKAEWPNGNKPLVIGTGGMAELIEPYSQEIEQVEPFLTLQGIRMGYELLTAQGGV